MRVYTKKPQTMSSSAANSKTFFKLHLLDEERHLYSRCENITRTISGRQNIALLTLLSDEVLHN